MSIEGVSDANAEDDYLFAVYEDASSEALQVIRCSESSAAPAPILLGWGLQD